MGYNSDKKFTDKVHAHIGCIVTVFVMLPHPQTWCYFGLRLKAHPSVLDTVTTCHVPITNL